MVTTLPIGWRLFADIGTSTLHWCRPGATIRYTRFQTTTASLLLKAHSGGDNEVIAGRPAGVRGKSDELWDVGGVPGDRITGWTACTAEAARGRCKEGCESVSLSPAKTAALRGFCGVTVSRIRWSPCIRGW